MALALRGATVGVVYAAIVFPSLLADSILFTLLASDDWDHRSPRGFSSLLLPVGLV